MERWIKINEGNYEVSNLGKVRNHTTKKILKNCATRDGYLRVCLQLDGGQKNMRVHRLVAMYFIPNPCNYPDVNHIDEDKSNNTYTNLEWLSRRDNLIHGTRIDRFIKSNSIAVVQMTLDGLIIAEHESAKKAAESIGVSSGSSITQCCKGFRKDNKSGNTYNVNSAHGYVWEYK